jgi:hypothetical protein
MDINIISNLLNNLSQKKITKTTVMKTFEKKVDSIIKNSKKENQLKDNIIIKNLKQNQIKIRAQLKNSSEKIIKKTQELIKNIKNSKINKTNIASYKNVIKQNKDLIKEQNKQIIKLRQENNKLKKKSKRSAKNKKIEINNLFDYEETGATNITRPYNDLKIDGLKEKRAKRFYQNLEFQKKVNNAVDTQFMIISDSYRITQEEAHNKYKRALLSTIKQDGTSYLEHDIKQINNFRYEGKTINEMIQEIRTRNIGDGLLSKIQFKLVFSLLKYQEQEKKEGAINVVSLFVMRNAKEGEDVSGKPKFIELIAQTNIDLITLEKDFDIRDILEKLVKKIEEGNHDRSGYIYFGFDTFKINIFNYKPLSGSKWEALPKELQDIGASTFINIKNYSSIKNNNKDANSKINENACFLYCYIFHKYKNIFEENKSHFTRDAESANNYDVNFFEENCMVNKIKDKKIGQVINYKNIDIPVKIDNIPKFEKQNDINIDVYTYIKKNKDESMSYERLYKSVGTYKDSMKLLLIEYEE